ncbi:Gfo/Idh/MocA family protein [Marinobacterium rhizophilum]|uniref:Gfo/Idh/MocA family oxidoreductase n=1 Tax=Marinobacterium rhizophilum TaxID=420402 RepID=A0ABY5HIU2_9GAMM|nr:Gfo/Idh/MocA family oxidoreductase [Marinobacterium rhizophilum]UTW11209.1 Gfo/Idh/MocA family oxidoreductase [Marinobacterium rhizophilum]
MFNEEKRFSQPIRWAMVGGGRGSEIGYAHRAAAQRDNLFQLTAGAFDLDPQRCQDFGTSLGVDPQRCYADYTQMFAAEAQREDGIQAVSIATPNCSHYAISRAALAAGLHVICEKPVTFSVTEAEDLKQCAQARNLVFGVMYGYSGFQMLHQAREMVRRGDIGAVRVVNMQFAHGFHNQAVEQHSPGARWRMNPEVSGPTYVLGDLGTHIFYAAQMITGLAVDRLCCHRQSFIETRAPLEDNAHVMLQFEGGAVGTLWASAVNAGSMHQQKIRIVGEKASLEWWDEQPNQLRYEVQGEPVRILERGMGYLHNDSTAVSCNRIGGGHAEGFFESWANLYHRFGTAMDAASRGEAQPDLWYPDIDSGIDGVRLLECCVESADNQSGWVKF